MGFLTISHKYMIQQYFTVTAPHSVFSQYIKQIKRFANAGDNIKFTDFNTHCCPKIRLCGWQKASHFTLVLFLGLLFCGHLTLFKTFKI